MARPKRQEGQVGARDLLVDAFWELLADRPYEKIKVKELSGAAGLNHNTFYYHFQCMDDLAHYAFDQAFPKELVTQMLPVAIKSDDAVVDFPADEFDPYFRRIRLFAKPDSPKLNVIAKERVEAVWLSALGLSRESLSQIQATSLSFLSAGALATIGSNRDFSAQDFSAMINGPVGKSVRLIIRSLVT